MSKDNWLSPADIARKLGLTVKALRVYEREGLVEPHRLSSGWRVYGPEQAKSLHAVIALRGLGFTLKDIKALLHGRGIDLGAMLALQHRALLDQKARLDKALDRLTSAQGQLEQGQALSLDDLIQLTQETQMSKSQAVMAFKAAYTKSLEERLPDGAMQDLLDDLRAAVPTDLAALKAKYAAFTEEARPFMTAGDETSEAVKDLVRRWSAASPVRDIPTKIERDALEVAFEQATQANPDIAAALPFDVEIYRFIGRIARAMRANGELI